MCLKTFIGERQHLVVHSAGIADTQHVDAAVHEFLAYPVDSHIALGAYQHLVLAHQCFTDGFHQGCRLTRSWRTVYNGYILGSQYHIDSTLLRRVQIREVHGWKDEGFWFLS